MFNCSQWKEVFFASKRKKVIYFDKFPDAAQFRIPENRRQTRHTISPESKAEVAQKKREKSLFSGEVEFPELGSHVQSRERNEFLNFISTVKDWDA